MRWVLGGVAAACAGIALLGSFNTRLPSQGHRGRALEAHDGDRHHGPYRLTRNPAYLGMALVYIGIALLADALWVLVPLPVVLLIIDRMVIAREERYLERKFGQEYLDYKGRVRRWV